MKNRLLSCLLVFLMSSSSEAAQCLHYFGSPVTLTGRLSHKTFFGPPNYGETPKTDSRETQSILALREPICVEADPEDYSEAEKDQLKITLVPLKDIRLAGYIGKEVTVSGTLFHAETGHHHTPVLMELNSIEVRH